MYAFIQQIHILSTSKSGSRCLYDADVLDDGPVS